LLALSFVDDPNASTLADCLSLAPVICLSKLKPTDVVTLRAITADRYVAHVVENYHHLHAEVIEHCGGVLPAANRKGAKEAGADAY
jgi:hypothetical protein